MVAWKTRGGSFLLGQHQRWGALSSLPDLTVSSLERTPLTVWYLPSQGGESQCSRGPMSTLDATSWGYPPASCNRATSASICTNSRHALWSFLMFQQTHCQPPSTSAPGPGRSKAHHTLASPLEHAPPRSSDFEVPRRVLAGGTFKGASRVGVAVYCQGSDSPNCMNCQPLFHRDGTIGGSSMGVGVSH